MELRSGGSGWLIFCCAAALSLVLWYAGLLTSEGAEEGRYCAFVSGRLEGYEKPEGKRRGTKTKSGKRRRVAEHAHCSGDLPTTHPFLHPIHHRHHSAFTIAAQEFTLRGYLAIRSSLSVWVLKSLSVLIMHHLDFLHDSFVRLVQ